MNTHDLVESECDKLLTEFVTDLRNMTPQQIAMQAFMRGWVHGLKDARRIHREETHPLTYCCAECGNIKPYHRATCTQAAANPLAKT